MRPRLPFSQWPDEARDPWLADAKEEIWNSPEQFDTYVISELTTDERAKLHKVITTGIGAPELVTMMRSAFERVCERCELLKGVIERRAEVLADEDVESRLAYAADCREPEPFLA